MIIAFLSAILYLAIDTLPAHAIDASAPSVAAGGSVVFVDDAAVVAPAIEDSSSEEVQADSDVDEQYEKFLARGRFSRVRSIGDYPASSGSAASVSRGARSNAKPSGSYSKAKYSNKSTVGIDNSQRRGSYGYRRSSFGGKGFATIDN